VEDDDKIVVREARLLRRFEMWDDRTARLFACDCAERALPLFESERPDDNRPREAIEVARRYANGEATNEELTAAADASWAASWDAAWNAARAAAWNAARVAAWAAWNEARAATWAATWAAEREWQYARLCEYLDGSYGQ